MSSLSSCWQRLFGGGRGNRDQQRQQLQYTSNDDTENDGNDKTKILSLVAAATSVHYAPWTCQTISLFASSSSSSSPTTRCEMSSLLPETQRQQVIPTGVDYRVEIHTQIRTAICTMTETFWNPSQTTATELVVQFVLDPSLFVKAFSACFSLSPNKELQGKLQPVQDALDEFDDTIAAGRSAALLTQTKTQQTAVLYSLSIGRLDPLETVTIRLTLVGVARDAKIVSATDKSQEPEVGLAVDLPLPAAMDQHNKLLTNNDDGVSSLSSPSGIQTRISVINNVTEHPISRIVFDGANVVEQVLSSSSSSASSSTKDFFIQSLDVGCSGHLRISCVFDTERPLPAHGKSLVLEHMDKSLLPPEHADKEWCACLTLTPALFYLLPSSSTSTTEIVFALDTSSSMCGHALEACKLMLQVFLSSLDFGTLFNITTFASSFSKLWPTSRPLDQETLETARQFVHATTAGGNTHLAPLLSDLLSLHDDDPAVRQIFLLTDGEVNESARCLGLVSQYRKQSRVFSIGIGGGADVAFVTGVAKVGGGKHTILPNISSPTFQADVAACVTSYLNTAMHPGLYDISMELPDGVTSLQANNNYPPIFDNTSGSFFFAVQPSTITSQKMSQIVVRGKHGSNNNSIELVFPITEDDLRSCSRGCLVHMLAAHHMLNELETSAVLLDSIETRAQQASTAVALSIGFGVPCSITGWICYENDSSNAREALRHPLNMTRIDRWDVVEKGLGLERKGVSRRERNDKLGLECALQNLDRMTEKGVVFCKGVNQQKRNNGGNKRHDQEDKIDKLQQEQDKKRAVEQQLFNIVRAADARGCWLATNPAAVASIFAALPRTLHIRTDVARSQFLQTTCPAIILSMADAETLWLTALALAVFELAPFKSLDSVWFVLARKCKRFLRDMAAPTSLAAEEWVKEAVRFVQTA